MEISNSDLNRTVELAVNFNNLEGTSSFDIGPAGSGSKLTWSFGYDTGSSPLKRWKALMLDGFIGAEYRAGLDKLKEKIEADRRPTASPTLGVVPPGGVSTQPEQPSAALPPGAAAPSGAAVAPGGTPTPGQPAPAGTAAPAVGGSQAAGTPARTQTGSTAPAPDAVTPAPKPKKPVRRRNQ
jgi:hypothetical protein